MVDDYKLDKVLDKSKETIGTEICDNNKTLIEKDDKLLDDVTLKNAVILITCVSQDDDKIYPQIF